MRLDFFTISILNPEPQAEELNRFLADHKVFKIDREFVNDGDGSFWSVCVTSGNRHSQQGGRKPSIDYREVLSPEDFSIFSRLRDFRKSLASRDGVPPYAVLTNEQLAAIVQNQITSLEALKALEGVGSARIEKYGRDILSLTSEIFGTKPERHEGGP